MRVVSLHPDVLLITSGIWQTNCTVVRAGSGAGGGEGGADGAGEAFAIDSPILPDELEALPAVLEQAGFSLSGLLATHGDWDHLLGRLAFPGASLGCAESTAGRLRAAPGEAQRELRAFDESHYLQRERPLGLGTLQALPVPGHCGIGGRELELHPAGGHTVDGMAILTPWAGVLVAGDYLSTIEIPFFGEGAGTLDGYVATLERLREPLGRAELVVPGHGPAIDAARARGVLEEDLAYLHDLRARGAEAELPPSRRTPFQRV
ncbi:MAG TPA: MBL fold metallo-hydrolase, partial [Solirubrobacteraceae bacterium]|nr:MBL fold metallo-hydrolase [Solirubrobacteraceae bacterium]